MSTFIIQWRLLFQVRRFICVLTVEGIERAMSFFALFIMVQMILPTIVCWSRCGKYDDTHGKWVDTVECQNNPHLCSPHFLSGPHEAYMFSQVWLPHNCAYFRFTNTSLFLASRRLAELYPSSVKANGGKLKIIFMGDSALRGIICGISRVLSGSEVFGPCMNRVCGDCIQFNTISYPEMGKIFDIPFGDSLILTFIYVKTFQTHSHLDWLVESTIDYNPAYALVFHQGIWDYDEYARTHRNETAPETECDGVYLPIAKAAASEAANHTMHDLGYFGKEHNLRLIFRNTHYNARYPAPCDRYFDELLLNSGWELWDNHRMSKEVWRDQTHDGFHFDRSDMCTVEDHTKERLYFEEHHRNYPGMLEAQLAQSLLNSIFHDVIPQLVINR